MTLWMVLGSGGWSSALEINSVLMKTNNRADLFYLQVGVGKADPLATRKASRHLLGLKQEPVMNVRSIDVLSSKRTVPQVRGANLGGRMKETISIMRRGRPKTTLGTPRSFHSQIRETSVLF